MVGAIEDVGDPVVLALDPRGVANGLGVGEQNIDAVDAVGGSVGQEDVLEGVGARGLGLGNSLGESGVRSGDTIVSAGHEVALEGAAVGVSHVVLVLVENGVGGGIA